MDLFFSGSFEYLIGRLNPDPYFQNHILFLVSFLHNLPPAPKIFPFLSFSSSFSFSFFMYFLPYLPLSPPHPSPPWPHCCQSHHRHYCGTTVGQHLHLSPTPSCTHFHTHTIIPYRHRSHLRLVTPLWQVAAIAPLQQTPDWHLSLSLSFFILSLSLSLSLDPPSLHFSLTHPYCHLHTSRVPHSHHIAPSPPL